MILSPEESRSQQTSLSQPLIAVLGAVAWLAMTLLSLTSRSHQAKNDVAGVVLTLMTVPVRAESDLVGKILSTKQLGPPL